MGKIGELRDAISRRFSNMAATDAPSDALSYARNQGSSAKTCMNEWPGLVESIPDSDGSRAFGRFDRKVGIITDDFMFDYYRDALDLVYLTPGNYRDEIDEGDLAFVLYVSCWYGLEPGREYRTIASEPTAEGKARGCRNLHTENVQDVFMYARAAGVPVVFQSIEDPTNYDHLIDIARYADFVFTSAEEVIDDYRRDCGHDEVFCLKYGINPRIHNPIGCFSEVPQVFADSAFFAGSWYEGFPDRAAAMELLFDGVIEAGHGLVIADRNLLSPEADRVTLHYPAKYNEYLIPPIDHVALQKVHKLFGFTLNVNTVVNSRTMCAMRAYEVPALGGLVISNDTPAMRGLSPAVFPMKDKSQVGDVLNMPERERLACRVAGIRGMYAQATVYDRLNEMFERVGIDYRFERPTVHLLCDGESDAIRALAAERLATSLKLVVEDGGMKQRSEGLCAFVSSSSPCWDAPHFFEDAVNAFMYANVDFVAGEVEARQSFRYVDRRIGAGDLERELVLFDGAARTLERGFNVYAGA